MNTSRHWYTATKATAAALSAEGCPIKEKPPVRVSSSNGCWMVLCTATQLYVAELAQQRRD